MNILLEKGMEVLLASKQKKCIAPDDVRLASVENHMPKIASNYRRCRKCHRKGQEKKTCYMCAKCDVPL
ncbi:hypothetical protein TNCV_1722701 [Trichonephila clavipes]|nr:hypothetical protein TNCV_1722701 [Trichonephila clavipes]